MFFRNWYYLYNKQTAAELAIEPAIAALGRRYRAQHPFPGLKHIADFALLDDKIIIEVDGASHQEEGQIRKDITHTLALARQGWRVVRCKNDQAITEPHLTVARLLEQATHPQDLVALEVALARLPVPPPKPAKRRAPKQGPAPVKSGVGARKARAAPKAG